MKIIRINFTLLAALSLVFSGCGNNVEKHASPVQFETDVLVEHTPVRQQGEWPASWIYATLGMVESERIHVGDSLELSATYLMRTYLEHQTVTNNHKDTFVGNPFSCLHLMENYGVLTFASYRSEPRMTWNNFRQCATPNNLQIVCDTGFAYVPRAVSLFGVLYTPVDLAESLFLENSYEGFTTNPLLPFGEEIQTQFPGDAANETYLNISSEALVRLVKATLYSGHSLVWMGDTTETVFSNTEGLAYLPAAFSSKQELEAKKREDYLRNNINPIYCLQIIGIARTEDNPSPDKSQNNGIFFICKDSQGTTGNYKGLMYLSENFIRLKTVAVYRHN